MTYIVALSGGVASGKSTIADLFAQQGVEIIDADIIAKTVVKKGTHALSQIVQHFGESMLLPSGELNRRHLREIIFHHEHERIWLNNLLHPIIQQETERQINQADSPYVLWVVPLLIENNLHHKADRVLIIETPYDIQLERLQKRDNIDQMLAKNMLSSQATNEQRVRYADDVIVNNGEAITLSSRVIALHQHYLKLSQYAK